MTPKTSLSDVKANITKLMTWWYAEHFDSPDDFDVELDTILAPLAEAAETTEMLLRLCECKAVGRTGGICIAPSPGYVEVTVWADAYGLVASGKTLHAALVEALDKAKEQVNGTD